MSKTKFDKLCNLEPGRFDWRIKVRIIPLWRGVSKQGEIFKGFNIILLDNKNNRMHAFVPANSVDKLEPNITIGKVCVIRKFTVQEYKIEDKFRCLRNNARLIFSNETQIKDIEDDGKTIEHNAFDFYDHSELMELTKQTTYLADVVGIIKFYQPLEDLVNKRGNPQKQVKFTITDGRSSVNVTFWDAFAEKFQEQMNQVSEKPVIVIIAGSRVGLWNDQVDISSVGGTICYLNYKHYSVLQNIKLIIYSYKRGINFNISLGRDVTTQLSITNEHKQGVIRQEEYMTFNCFILYNTILTTPNNS